MESHLIEAGGCAEGEVVQVNPSVAGQDAIRLLVEPDVDLVHKNLTFHRIKSREDAFKKEMPCRS